MPLYESRCNFCGKGYEEVRRIADYDKTPECCGKPTDLVLSSPVMIAADIEPYLTIAADKETGKRAYISSRSQHKEFLRKNNYEEIGNEKLIPDQE